MRKSALTGLRWTDCDLDAGIIHVSQVALAVHKKGMVISEPKTEKSRRSIGLPPVTVEALKVHKEKQERYKNFQGFKDRGLVFPTKRGTPIGSRNLLRYFYEALERARLPRVRFHSLRHLHATLLLTLMSALGCNRAKIARGCTSEAT
jgi:integrase